MRIVEFWVVLLLFGCRNNKYTGGDALLSLSSLPHFILHISWDSVLYYYGYETYGSSCAWGQCDALSTTTPAVVVGFYNDLRIVPGTQPIHIWFPTGRIFLEILFLDDPK